MSANNPQAVAARMVELYRSSSYSAHERATDHAFSYDRGAPGFRYWLAVADEIKKLASG
jgi:hypothetical protein